jgi:outer membrane protein assembly factor BamB
MVEDKITIGGGGANQFGSAFYAGTETIGGERDYCQQGACMFALGVRVFFLLDFSQQGDGITFTLLNASGKDAEDKPLNSASSVGGDFQLSELMGYAGDSRLDAAGTIFLATNEDDRGLDPPKIAVEFDTQTNKTAGDPPPDYCADISTANEETRNDPIPFDPPEIDPPEIRDMVQYVFWGRTSFLNIPCRPRPWLLPPETNSNPLYDDNRHDADGEEATEEWRFGLGGVPSIWRPAIGPDGTIYASDQVNTLYAFDEEDGTTPKWTFNLGDASDYMPGVDPVTGTIYSDIAGNALVAIDPERNELWRFNVASDIDSTPVVGPDGRVYFGTDAEQSLFAIDPVAREQGLPFPQIGEWKFPTNGEIDNVPVLSPDGTTVYFVANDNFLYALKMAAREADPDPDPATEAGKVNTLLGEWKFGIDTDQGEINSSPTVNPSDGTIYVGSSDDHSAFALDPAAREAGLAFPQPGEWQFNPGTGRDMESSPTFAINPIDGIPTVYIGSDDGNLYAIDANTGDQLWRFDTGSQVVSSPIVDLDGTIYVGADNGNVYAVNPSGTQKWLFSAGSIVRSSPAIGQAGFIHIGSSNTNFYTISQFADPRNFKDEDKRAGKLLTIEDLDSTVSADSDINWLNGAGSKGSWAVRLEVECLLRDESQKCTSNIDGDYEYELRLWIRQCADQNDFPCDKILGTFYQDSRLAYNHTAVKDLPMRQHIRLSSALSSAPNGAFERFFFGFTGAAGAEALDATISQFQLSFIRPGDPVVDCDSDNWPVELSDIPPLENCTVTN